MSTTVTMEQSDGVAVITVDNPPVNALSHSVREGLAKCIAEIDGDAAVKAAVLTCNGRTFIAGADIAEFGKPPREPLLPEVVTTIMACSKPIIAALHGTVLGGGMETALACHYRVAVPTTKLGLPEITLGLIPGAGGTQMLPRLAGLPQALEMITSGKPMSVSSEIGRSLVDRVLDEGDDPQPLAVLRESAIQFAHELIAEDVTPRRLSAVRLEKGADHDALFSKWRATMAKKKRGLIAGKNAVDAIENAVLLPFDEGLAAERQLFVECRDSSQSAAMRHAFFAERSCLKVDGVSEDASAHPIHQIGIIGAGTMGVGIAIAFADAGLPVTLIETDQARVDAGLGKVEKNYARSVERGRLSEPQAAERIAKVTGSVDYADLSDVDLVIEAAFESMDVKTEIFTRLDAVCKDSAILASNTSYLDLDRIAEVTTNPARVVGMHFFSPANIMKLLEVVRGHKTSDQALLTAIAVGKQIGKIPVTVGVCYGFVGNRMYAKYQSQAQQLLLEGVSPEKIDAAMRDWGMAMGPIEVVDLTGLDIGYKARQQQPNLPDDPTYFAAQAALVEADRLGQKSEIGFYRYVDGKKQNDEESLAIIRATAERLKVPQQEIDADEIPRRLIAALVNEGRAILEEGIAQRASDIDVIWLNGYGFPRHRGGPMWFTDEQDQ